MVDVFLWSPGWQRQFPADVMLWDGTIPPDPQLNPILDYRPTAQLTHRAALLSSAGFIDSNWPVSGVPSFDWFYDAAQRHPAPRPAFQPWALTFTSDPATDARLESWTGVAGQDRRQPRPNPQPAAFVYELDYPTVKVASGIGWFVPTPFDRRPPVLRSRDAEGLVYVGDFFTVNQAKGIAWLVDTSSRPAPRPPRHPEASGLVFVSDPATDARLLSWQADQAAKRQPIGSHQQAGLVYEFAPSTIKLDWLMEPGPHRPPLRPVFQPLPSGPEFTPSAVVVVSIDWLSETAQAPRLAKLAPQPQLPPFVLEPTTIKTDWIVEVEQRHQAPKPAQQPPALSWEFERSTIKVDWQADQAQARAFSRLNTAQAAAGLTYVGDAATEAVLLAWAADSAQPRRALLAAAALLASGSTFVGDPGQAPDSPPLAWDVPLLQNIARPQNMAAQQASGLIYVGQPVSAINFMCGFESGDASELTGDGGALGAGASIVSYPARTGQYCLKVAGTSTTWGGATRFNATIWCATFSFLMPVLPGAQTNIFQERVSSTAARMRIRVNASNQLEVFDSGASLGLAVTAGSTVLKAWRYYQVQVRMELAAAGRVQVYLDDALEISTTHTNSVTGAPTTNCAVQGAATPNEYFFDDLAFQSTFDLIGSGGIIGRQGTAGAPTYDAWTKNGAATSALCWSDTPFNAATNCTSSTSGAAQTMKVAPFSQQQAGHGPETIPPAGVIRFGEVGAIAKRATGGNPILRLRANGQDYDTAVTTFGTTDLWKKAVNFAVTTPAAADALEAGMVKAADANLTTCEDVWVMLWVQGLSQNTPADWIDNTTIPRQGLNALPYGSRLAVYQDDAGSWGNITPPVVFLEWFMDGAPRVTLTPLPVGARQDSNQDPGGILSIIPIPPVGEFNYGLTAGPQISDQGGLTASHAQGLGRHGLHGIPQTDPP